MRAINLSLAFFLIWFSSLVYGHFQLNVNIRVVHVAHLSDGLRVYLRLPTPYVLAQLLGEERADDSREPAPYTYHRRQDGQLMHYIDFDALKAEPIGLGEMIERGHELVVEGVKVQGSVEAVRLHTVNNQPPFATLEEAKKAFTSPPRKSDNAEAFVGDTVTDVIIHYPSASTVYNYTLSSSLNPGLENQEETANLVLDHFPGNTQIFRATGLLDNPVSVRPSALAAALTFIEEGVRHILKGYDHVLFVVCLILGAMTFTSLLWRVTGFTVGHSLTLTLGFFGWAPDADWFIPAIETGIALSIIYAAVTALARHDEKTSFLVTIAIGLLHGLGFSFVLQEILQVSSPNIWQSLLAFNIGVELGQLCIVLLIWPALYWLQKSKPTVAHPLRWTVALPCVMVAALWAGQRTVLFWQAL